MPELPKEEFIKWKRAYLLIRDAAALDEGDKARELALTAARSLMSESGVPRLVSLARLLLPPVSARRLLCVLVPLERVASRDRITDADMGITSSDSAEMPAAPRMRAIAVADNIRSAVNTGGLFRTCEFFGFEELWLCGYTATPEFAQVSKSAMGTEKFVNWKHFDSIGTAIEQFRSMGTHIYALETARTALDASQFRYEFPCALLLGNERFGLRPDTVSECDAVVQIRSCGLKNSLNVVSAFAIAAAAMRRSSDSQHSHTSSDYTNSSI